MEEGTREEQQLRMFVMRPLSGKTHQLRVALRALAAPILVLYLTFSFLFFLLPFFVATILVYVSFPPLVLYVDYSPPSGSAPPLQQEVHVAVRAHCGR